MTRSPGVFHPQPVIGTATASGTGNSKAINYIPNTDYTGLFVCRTGGRRQSGTDTITVNVTIDTPPVSTEGVSTSVTMSKNSSPIAFALTLHATDADNDTLTWSISSPANHGTAGVPVSNREQHGNQLYSEYRLHRHQFVCSKGG